ncbi:hypothetical protein RclHR1_08970007 [Rhizophagus clarus]|uniref:DUF659 domain-containing protein n=1 Tax=Rhizophagus clarus TaxID=94130 RepID=A0A2Z6SP98_9GLOM|nr:hypothetical protein RclHR1_08970007 [Rhizophagus clarus]
MIRPINNYYYEEIQFIRSSLSSLPSQWSNHGPLDKWVCRSLSTAENQKFRYLILRITISCGFPLSWVNNSEVIELFKFLNPEIKLPDRKKLFNKILGVTMSFDGWTNVHKHELMGTVLVTSDGQLYAWQVKDISTIITDNEPAYNAARLHGIKRLRIQYRNIVFLPCFAHRRNLCVGDIFKALPDFKLTSDQEIYGKYIQTAVPGYTRWNSYLNCCQSLISTKEALHFTRVLEMAKLRADINYNRCNDQQSANNTTENENKNKNEEENENERYLQNEELNNNDLNNQDNIDLKENSNFQFNDHLNEWLEELQQEESNKYDSEHEENSESEKRF